MTLTKSFCWRKSWVIWILAVLLTACAPTFAYRHADWLVLWKVDHYVDLTSDQKSFIRRRLKEMLARHRHESLPIYEQFLSDIKLKSSDGLNPAEIDWAFSTYRQLRADLFDQVVSDGAMLLVSATEQQINQLTESFREDNEKTIRLLKEKTEKRIGRRTSATIDQLKEWLGPLNADQKQRITQLSQSLPDIQGIWLEFQKVRQQELLALLGSTRDPQTVSRRLRDWLVFPEKHWPAEYKRALEDMQNAAKEMVLRVDQIVTPKQRSHALMKLQDLINDVHALAAS